MAEYFNNTDTDSNSSTHTIEAKLEKIIAGGYDYNFLIEPPDSLKCLICLLVVREPQQHGDCGRVFCKSCITEYRTKSNGGVCPFCRDTLTMFYDGRSALEVKSLSVSCNNKGCLWQGELRSIEKHLDNCEHTLTPCPNNCNTKKIFRKDLKFHLNSECPKREYTCPHCQEEGQYEEMTTTHLEECEFVKVACLNHTHGCEEKVCRKDMEDHLEECEYDPVKCKYADLGCVVQPLRKDKHEHENDYQIHLQITMEKVLQLNETTALLTSQLTTERENVKKLKKKLLSLKRYTIIKISKFSRRKAGGRAFTSCSFYTSSSSYKMCLEVYANGDGDGKGTHVSVFVYLMKGDNDDSLSWPFTGTVTVELLNQLEDKNHYKKTITFPADNEVSQRVVDGEKAEQGWGQRKFLSYAQLKRKPHLNRQYLKDDTLVFRVSAEDPDYKPWLECDD